MEQNPYSGNGKPFVYAMFAPEDREGVTETLDQLREKGFALWPSERFDKRRIEKSALFLLFLSPAAAQSEAVNRAINYVVQSDHPMLSIYLAPTVLSPAQRLLLNSQQGIMRYESATSNDYFEKLFGSSLLQNLAVTPAQKREASFTTWGLSLGILLAVAAAIVLALGGGATVPKDSLLAELGYSGRMAQIEGIYLYGDQVASSASEEVFLGKAMVDDATEAVPVVVYQEGENANFGEIADVSDFGQLNNLKYLSLAGNRVQDITPLYTLKNLTTLDLTGNPVENISGIGVLKRLKTLHITGTQVADLAPLFECGSLKTVYVDEAQYARFEKQAAGAAFKLVVPGPVWEIRSLSCHIFAGPEEYDRPNTEHYGVFIQTGSKNTYDGYTYTVLKDGATLPIVKIDDVDTNGDGEGEKTHLIIKISDMQRYNPQSTYTLVVSYKAYSATYRIWHKYDKTGQNPIGGILISSDGFDAPAQPTPN